MTNLNSPAGILLTVAYDGANFHGYAPQPKDRTVAGSLLSAIQSIDPSVPCIRGASRTDAGVHAKGQLVAFDSAKAIPLRGWVLALTSRLPVDLVVRCACSVEPDFDPRHAPLLKHYRYTVLLDGIRDPFLDASSWRVGAPFDVDLAHKAAQTAVGTHDFRAFRSAADERVSTIRTIYALDVKRSAADPRILHIDVFGSAFLHNMVRILAGTLVDIGKTSLDPNAIAKALESGSRADLGVTAPASGLCLQRIWLRRAFPPDLSWPSSGAWPSDDSLLPKPVLNQIASVLAPDSTENSAK